MTLQLVTFQMTIQDADGERFSMPLYGLFNDEVATLANLIAYVTTLAEDVDTITDGQIVKVSFSMALDTGEMTLKGAPVANSEIERTGLISFNLEASPYSFAIDVPAFAVSKFTGNAIDTDDVDVAALISQLQAVSSTFQAVEPVSGKAFAEVRSARKTFRKHRGSTKRS